MFITEYQDMPSEAEIYSPYTRCLLYCPLHCSEREDGWEGDCEHSVSKLIQHHIFSEAAPWFFVSSTAASKMEGSISLQRMEPRVTLCEALCGVGVVLLFHPVLSSDRGLWLGENRLAGC